MKLWSSRAAWFALLASVAPSAFAIGDPVVVYIFGGAILAHLSALIWLLWRWRQRRSTGLAVILSLPVIAGAWLWALNIAHVSNSVFSIVFVLVPILVLLWLGRNLKHPK